MQAQIPATGVINLVHNPKTLFVYASTNGSALLDGNLTDVYLNVASSQPVIITNAQRVRPTVPLAFCTPTLQHCTALRHLAAFWQCTMQTYGLATIFQLVM